MGGGWWPGTREHVCMYVCMYVCMIYVCVCRCVCVHVSVSMCVCRCIGVAIGVGIYGCICMCTCVYACMYVCIYVHTKPFIGFRVHTLGPRKWFLPTASQVQTNRRTHKKCYRVEPASRTVAGIRTSKWNSTTPRPAPTPPSSKKKKKASRARAFRNDIANCLCKSSNIAKFVHQNLGSSLASTIRPESNIRWKDRQWKSLSSLLGV